MKTGKLISACMMVKNEEANLPRCLNSIKNLVDEIIVVDTGSTDNTIKIAQDFGCKVFHHPWENNFSLHRNQSIKHATCDWVFIIDADEEIFLEDGYTWEQTRDLLKRINSTYPASAIVLKDTQKGLTVMQFNSTRFFKRGKVHYEGIVHNQPQVDGESILNTMMYLKHYGYDLTPEQKIQKYNRTHTLLMKQVEDNQLTDGLPYFYLCQLTAENQKTEEATEWGEKYWGMYEQGKIKEKYFNHVIYFTMTKQYMKLGNQPKAFEWLQRGISKLNNDLDMAMAALEYGIWTNSEDLILNAAKDYIALYDLFSNHPEAKEKRFIFTLRPELLALAQYHLSITHLKVGMSVLDEMFQTIKPLPQAFKNGLISDFDKDLKDSGLPIRLSEPEEKNIASNKTELTTMSI